MFTNLLRPWILARLLSGTAVMVLCLVALVVAWRVLAHWRIGRSSEGQLALERRAELGATIVQVTLGVAVLNLALTVLMADRLTHSIRGAMCAWGVFDASPWGFWALGASALTALGCALWVVLHRLDLRLERPTLTRRKFVGLFPLAPLVTIDLALTSAWVLDLDMQVVASCCSLGLDDALGGTDAAGGGPRELAALVGLGAGLGAAGAGLTLWRRPGRVTAALAAALSTLAALAFVPAVLWYVAPHAYETPAHLCPFCLLHADVGGLGWPLFAGWFGGTVSGLAAGLVETQRRASGEPAQVGDMSRRLGKWSALLWLSTLALGAAPVLRYAWITGGASLFGGT